MYLPSLVPGLFADVPTFLVHDPRSKKAVLCIGPAPGARIAGLMGDLQELA